MSVSIPQRPSGHSSRVPMPMTTSAVAHRSRPTGSGTNSGCAVGSTPWPIRRVVTGACSRTARASTSVPASCAPPPTTINGRSAPASNTAARCTAPSSISGMVTTGSVSVASAGADHRSTGTSMLTGRGRPETSSSKLSWICCAADAGSTRSSLCFVSCLRIAVWSGSSWSTPQPRPIAFTGIWPTTARTRALLQYPLVSAADALSRPGPGTTQHAAGLPVACAAPTAM